MARLNASANDRFTRQLQRRWEREQQAKRIIEPEPEETVASVAVDLQAPIDELPEDDPRRIMFDSIGKAMDEMAGITDLPMMPRIIGSEYVPPNTMYILDSKYFSPIVLPSSSDPDPPVETKVYIDNQEVATVQRESMFGGKAIEFAEDQAAEPRFASYSLLEQLREEIRNTPSQPVFQFRTFETPEIAPRETLKDKFNRELVLNQINEATRQMMPPFFGPQPYCKANCGFRTPNQSGYCTTCLDRMAVVGRTPEPTMKTPLVEMRPKRQIQLED